jgi:hypothetical protein
VSNLQSRPIATVGHDGRERTKGEISMAYLWIERLKNASSVSDAKDEYLRLVKSLLHEAGIVESDVAWSTPMAICIDVPVHRMDIAQPSLAKAIDASDDYLIRVEREGPWRAIGFAQRGHRCEEQIFQSAESFRDEVERRIRERL